jgi:hypothetical protein
MSGRAQKYHKQKTKKQKQKQKKCHKQKTKTKTKTKKVSQALSAYFLTDSSRNKHSRRSHKRSG